MTTAADLLRAELDRQHVTDNVLRAGLAAIIGGESNWKPQSEVPYTRTANARIRRNFACLRDESDAFIDKLKANPERFFNYVYGPKGAGPQLGNTEDGDGYKFRGRGGIQLTGRGNYQKLAELTGLDLVEKPDLVNEQQNSVVIAVAYIRWRYRGGGWKAIKAAVGNSFGPVDARKNELFQQYMASGEFAVGASEPQPQPAPDEDDESIGTDAVDRVKAIQAILGVDDDGKFGPVSEKALSDLTTQAWAELRRAG